MKAKELKQKSQEELQMMFRENKEKIRSLCFDLAGGKLKKTDQIGKTKKEIARILTILKA